MSSPIRAFFEVIWLYCKGFRPVEFVHDEDRISLHPSGWRVNGSGKFKRAKDAVNYLESASPEQWRQIYCGMTPFLVSDKGNVKHIDGGSVKMNLANGRYQIMYKPEDPRGRGKDGRIHKKRVYRSMLVAMAWLDFRKGDTEHEIHHINGYRTDDRVANLMVVDHDEHMRIHNLGPCALSGLPDERIAEAATTCENETSRHETHEGSHVALKPAEGKSDNDGSANRPKKKRRRGKRGGRKNAATCPTPENKTEDKHEMPDGGVDKHGQANETSGNSVDSSNLDETERAIGPVGNAKQDNVDAKQSDASRTNVANKDNRSVAENGSSAPTQPTAKVETEDKNSADRQKHDNRSKNRRRSKSEAQTIAETKNDAPFDWEASRTDLAHALDRFLEAVCPTSSEEQMDEKRINKAAKPVYKALKPFLTCPDAVTAFDAALSGIRTVVQAYGGGNAAMPAPVHSMLGTMHQVVKDAVKRIAANGDKVETTCLRELLCDETAKPLFKKTPHARKFRQCISIIDSRNETEPEHA